jgi:hypothetical protein
MALGPLRGRAEERDREERDAHFCVVQLAAFRTAYSGRAQW